MTINAKEKRHILLPLCIFIVLSCALTCHAEDSDPYPQRVYEAVRGSGDGVSGSGAVLPDLFTGTMSYSIPIEVAPGRKGMQPNLALTYRSNNGNGWVGVGWDLEVGAIERRATKGVIYNDNIDTYVLRIAGSAVDLIYDSSAGFYRAKIEGGFYKVEKKSSYWQVTDKTGRKYLFGQTYASRQDDPGDPNRNIPANPNKIFKWCLDHIEDTNGNYMDISYEKNPLNGTGPYEGQIYLKQIDYTGNSVTNAQPTNHVHFYLESRTDAPDMYTTNFRVRTAYRLKTIDVSANGNPVTTYQLAYSPYSAATARSLLASVQQFGKDGTSALPAKTFTWQDSAAQSGTFAASPDWPLPSAPGYVGAVADGNYYTSLPGDFNGDGKTDIFMFNAITCDSIVWINNGNGTFTEKELNLGFGSGYIALLGDFNGDGIADIYLFNFNAGDHIIFINPGDGTFSSTPTWKSQPGYGIGYSAFPGDLNGDGKTDIYMFNSAIGDHIVWLNNGNGTFNTTSSPWWSWEGQGYGTQWLARLGDFNGDGKADIHMFEPVTGDHVVWLNNGDGTFPKGASTL